jgi:RNA polymerase sigma-70 factor, ECF subfamily
LSRGSNMNTPSPKSVRSVSRKEDDGAVLHFIGFEGDDEALLAAIKKGSPNAKRALFERYANHVQRVLIRIIGIDDAVPELINETFLQAFSGIHSLRDGARLKAWISMVAVFTARGLIRKRKKRRLLCLLEPQQIQDARTCESDTDGRETLRALFSILEDMPVDERIAFSLRFLNGMGLREAAEACGVSTATIKRRISRAEKLFVPMARKHPLLSEWMKRGERWRVQL